MAKASPPDTTGSNRLFLLGIVAVVVLGLAVVAVLASNRESASVASDGAETGTVVVDGETLQPLPQGVQVGDSSTDPTVGQVAPTLTGTSFDGSEVVIGPDGSAKVVYFVAHWCPHCQDEIPLLQGLIDDGEQPDGLEIYAVSTAVDDGRGNFPPSAWLEREGFTPTALRDDDAASAFAALGGTAFPFAVYLDADHRVVARSAGNIDEATTEQLWQAAVS